MIFGNHDKNTLEQFEDIKSRAKKAALMADGHFGYVMPIGGVAAYDNQISVIGVGFDIACGNCAIQTSQTLENLTGISLESAISNPFRIRSNPILINLANDIVNTIAFGLGRTNLADDAPTDHELFLNNAWYIIPNKGDYRDLLREKARKQLGTVGSGNHYVDIFVDEQGKIWVGVHFGSRGFGHTIASNFLALSQGKQWGERGKEEEILLDLDSDLGKDYWALMTLAGEYAYAGREWVARKIMSILDGSELDLVHNNHNFAWKETHEGQELIVIRKGATPAFPQQRGFIGGSMGDNSVIVVGNIENNSIQTQALYSTVHGAGRVMGRVQAKGKVNKKGIVKRRGLITRQMMSDWIQKAGVIVRGGDVDESPHVYRRLNEVLKQQGNTINILHTLKPLVVVMAGANVTGHYKD